MKRMSLKAADELARLIYADVISPAIDEVNQHWEQLSDAKENDQLN